MKNPKMPAATYQDVPCEPREPHELGFWKTKRSGHRVQAPCFHWRSWGAGARSRTVWVPVMGLAVWLALAQHAGVACATVYCVDSVRGADTNAGTESAPWKSLKRVNQAMASLRPGDAVLFRRGGVWAREALKIRSKGTADSPITVGAYGPSGEVHPSLHVVEIEGSENIVVRDLELSHSTGGPCLTAAHSGYLTVMSNVIHDCANNGIVYGALTHHTATIGNVIYKVAKNDGISIHDSNWGTHPEPVGSHHWVVDNVIYDIASEDCIDAATNDGIGSPDARAGEDIKIIGNRCARAKGHGIVAGHEARRIWVIGNTILDCARTTANALTLGNRASGGTVQASGNLLIDNMRRVELQARGRFEHNTILSRNAIRTPVVIGPCADGLSVQRNLFVTTFGEWLAVDPGQDLNKVQSDWNWYYTLSGEPSTGKFRYGPQRSWVEWRTAFKQDANSAAGVVPGLTLPPLGGGETNLTAWDKSFFADYVSAPGWPGFNLGGGCVGAFGLGGQRLGMDIVPFEGYDENGGFGWAGPPIIQQRYPLRKTSK